MSRSLSLPGFVRLALPPLALREEEAAAGESVGAVGGCQGGGGGVGWGLQHVVNPWQQTGGSLFLAVLTACVVFKARDSCRLVEFCMFLH